MKRIIATSVLLALISVLVGCPGLIITPTTTTSTTSTTSTTVPPVFTYTVVYDGNGNTGGSVPTDSTTYHDGDIVTVSGNTGALVRSGFSFGGWNTTSSATGADRMPATTFAIGTANVTLYAKWGTESISMISVPAGSFDMGTNSSLNDWERPVHSVSISEFRMGMYEVTQSQYQTVTGSNPSGFSSGADAPSRPVENVTWYDAVEFCNQLSLRDGFIPVYAITSRTPSTGNPILAATVVMDITQNGYRLPTEAELEYAARGGNGSPGGYVHAGSDTIGTVSWYAGNSLGTTHPVGEKVENGLGLHDMTGNVWEWAWNWYASYGSATEIDPTGPATGTNRIYRNGSFQDESTDCRSFSRYELSPGLRYNSIGFRVVRRP